VTPEFGEDFMNGVFGLVVREADTTSERPDKATETCDALFDCFGVTPAYAMEKILGNGRGLRLGLRTSSGSSGCTHNDADGGIISPRPGSHW
jgi:hypothetical protein